MEMDSETVLCYGERGTIEKGKSIPITNGFIRSWVTECRSKRHFFSAEYFYYSFIYLSVCMGRLKQGAHRFHLDRFDCRRENNIPPRYRMVYGHQYTGSRRFDIYTCIDLHLGMYRSQDITKYRYTLSSIRFPQF